MSDQQAPSTPVTPPENSAPASQHTTAVAERKPRLDQLPPYKVILHNDDEVAMEHVVQTLVMLTPLPPQRAVEVMLEAHTTGTALILATHRERAELYAEQLRSRSLTATIEPA